MDRASQTLSGQGLKVEPGPRKSASTWISTEGDGWRATVYFDEEGRMKNILVITHPLTKEAVAAAKERLTKRFGAVKETTVRTERTWGSRIGGKGPWAILFVADIPDEGWIAREEYGGGEAGRPAGAFDLTWGQAAPEVEERLRAAGFEVRTTAMLIDPCKFPNSPPDCEPGSGVSVVFRKGDDEGNAEVDKKRGLGQITFRAKVASYADGLARAKAIEALRGPATAIEDATITTWGDATAEVSLDVRDEKPKGTLSAIERYSPPGKER